MFTMTNCLTPEDIPLGRECSKVSILFREELSCKAEFNFSTLQYIMFSDASNNNFKSDGFKNVNHSNDKIGLFTQNGFLSAYFVPDVF